MICENTLFILFLSTALGKSFFENDNPTFVCISSVLITLQPIEPTKKGLPKRKTFEKSSFFFRRKPFLSIQYRKTGNSSSCKKHPPAYQKLNSVLDRQFFSPITPPARYDRPPILIIHPLQKSMPSCAAFFLRLIGSFRHMNTLSRLGTSLA